MDPVSCYSVVARCAVISVKLDLLKHVTLDQIEHRMGPMDVKSASLAQSVPLNVVRNKVIENCAPNNALHHYCGVEFVERIILDQMALVTLHQENSVCVIAGHRLVG